MDIVKNFDKILYFVDFIATEWVCDRFLPSEFFKSETAKKLGIVNCPDDPHLVLSNILQLANLILVPVRKRINMPITISSGFRCSQLNSAVGGAARSYHMEGRAVDIYCANLKALDDAIVAVNEANLKAHLPVLKEFIRHKNFIHIAL